MRQLSPDEAAGPDGGPTTDIAGGRDAAGLLSRIERCLTDASARMLALGAERLRLEREIAHVSAALVDGDGGPQASELARLVRVRAAASREAAALESLLSSLRARQREIRSQPIAD